MTLYHRAKFYALLALLVVCLAWIAELCIPRKADIESYHNFMEKSKVVASSKALPSADQKREKVRKDIWFTQEDHLRLHTRLQSKASVLTLLPNDHKMDIIENLETIQCWMQDRLFTANGTPMQQMRFFEADYGTYQYMTQQFLAKEVSFSLFRIPGFNLSFPTNSSGAFLKGIAKDASFSVSGKTSQLQAQQFKATLNNEDLR